MDNYCGKKHIIIVFYGVSGSGKSMLLNMMKSIFVNVSLHRKDSTRAPRKNEPEDGTPELRLVKKLDPKNNYLMVYRQYGCQYGIRKDQLNRSFENNEIHLIIITTISALKKFKSFYPYAITVYVHSDPSKIPRNLRRMDTLEYERRKPRIKRLYRDFVNNNTLFDFIILNFWNKKNALKQAENMIRKYLESKCRLIHSS